MSLQHLNFSVLALFFAAAVPHSVAAQPQILEPGEFHADEISDDAAGMWWALCDDTAESRVVRAQVTLERVQDPIVDDELGWRVTATGCENPVALIRGVRGLSRGTVARASMHEVSSDAQQVDSSSPTALTSNPGFGERSAHLMLESRDALIRESRNEQGYSLTMNSRGKTQILYATDFSDDGSWDVRWAGDLNGDGEMDLLLRASDDHNVSALRLLLSDPGGNLREVATFETVGC